ncbi:class I SAM-dependent methyltransferase [Cereibacter sphaeroides]|uniref:class I SAM-dependent methyltransferase n=1 Tax=Cereibacter sphaeroides TaxID=1063 RepID=UPI001F3A2C11|nr:class I SAM-dependent methyltransferase [Cereibacter sphaeroides]MCE6957644.1 class I SAM-dependent methyltransferase [Cereibacter sphaeroides]MCE6971143.1 class I SAM-dependent methyltransferase [Cereibacter sphaeroides]
MGVNQAQEDYWASPAGLKWIKHERVLDAAMAGMLDVMLDAAGIAPSDRILDIGCGTGASTIGASRRAPNGHVLGLDISRPLLDRASTRAREEGIANASFVVADAQTYHFTAPAFGVLISRIGMSFFADPVSALKNLASALEDGGRMAFVCWAAAERNPWFQIPKQAAEARLGAGPAADPRAPGPTAFQDIHYVTELMARAGLSEVDAKVLEIWLTPPNGAQGAALAASRVGPAARIIKARQGNEADAHAIEHKVADGFLQFEHGGEVRIPAVVNLFTCRAQAG